MNKGVIGDEAASSSVCDRGTVAGGDDPRTDGACPQSGGTVKIGHFDSEFMMELRKNLILRRLRSGRLEGRPTAIQPILDLGP